MKITRKSHLSGVTRTLDLDITKEQLLNYERGFPVQDAFPNLTSSEREFFMTGITEDEWDDLFGGIEDED